MQRKVKDSMTDNTDKTSKKISPLIGQKIVDIRQMTEEEIKEEGWDDGYNSNTAVIVLSKGTILYASRDEEGNGPGVMFGKSNEEPIAINITTKTGETYE